MSTLNDIVDTYRVNSKSEREKGTYFEELIRTYFRHEPSFADLYSDVLLTTECLITDIPEPEAGGGGGGHDHGGMGGMGGMM